ncbi:hypothetical protein ACN2A0_04130 [Aerococcus viridans]
MKLNLATLLANLLFLFVLFPYVSLINTPFDTQPYALVISTLIFLVTLLNGNDKMPKALLALFMLAVVSFILMFLSPQTIFSGFRSVVGYMTLFLVSYAAYKTFYLIQPKILTFATWVWLIVGIIQTVFSKQFGSVVLPSLRTSVTRGVTSLAVEPSYYAIVMIFILLLNEIFYSKGMFSSKQYKNVLLLGSLQVLLSFSGMGIMFFATFVVFKTISIATTKGITSKIRSLVIFLLVTFATITAFTYIPTLAQSRGGVLLWQVIKDPWGLIMSDQSVAQRLSHILISGFSIFQNFGIGHGVGQFEIKAMETMGRLPKPVYNMLVMQGITPSGRIMSGWGSSIFEMGIMGLLPLVLFIYVMKKAIKKADKSVYVTCFGVIFVLMWMAVPYSFPLFAYLMGITLYDVYRTPQTKGDVKEIGK